MPSLDIDAQVAAREPCTIRFRGRDWSIRSSVPMSLLSEFDGDEEAVAAKLANPVAILRFIEAFFDPADVEDFRATDPALDEVMAIAGVVMEITGMAPGESSASSGSS